MAANLITGFGCGVDSVVVSDMDNEDVLLILVCVVVDAVKAEAEEIKASDSARMLESFIIAIGRCIDTELCGLLSIATSIVGR